VSGEFRPEDLRDALSGAGTDIWEWDLDSDALSDSDHGFLSLGYRPGQFAQTQAAWSALIHAEDRAHYDASFAAYRRGETSMWQCVYRIRAQDGGWRHFEERGRFVAWHADGRPRRMLGTQTDVTEREALRGHAAAALQQLADLARETPGMLFQFRREPDGRAWFPYASERCETLLGLTPAALHEDAASMLALLPHEQRAGMLASIQQSAAELGPWRLQFCVHLAGQTRCLRGSASPRREDDGATLWHGHVEDVTELLLLEQAQQERDAAERASRAKTTFLSRISHELRTPLNAVLGFTQLLESDPADPPSAGQRQRLQLVRESGLHLLRMISDLLDLTRAESGEVALQLTPQALAPTARECLAMLAPSAAAAGVVLDAMLDDTLRANVDAARLRQVLLNLLDNAIKYNRRGGRVELGLRRADDEAIFEVRDDGIGISDAELPHLFDPFWRSPSARPAGEGSGIGLAVTRSLVDAMHGRIEVDSTPGQGSCFGVRLPLA
jgi:signal transduction histidine kinase